MSKHVEPVKIDVALSTHRFYKDKQAIRFQIFYTFVQKKYYVTRISGIGYEFGG